jgi:cytochrome c oxidase assembly protein subunit 15
MKTVVARHFYRAAWVATLLTFALIVFGAFVRLSNAGLSCPDWPTCYGQVTWPEHEHEIAQANAEFTRAVEPHKAWREQGHRMLAGALGLMIFGLALAAARKRPHGPASLLGAAALVAVSIPLYIKGYYTLAAAGALGGEALLLASAIRWSGGNDHARLATVTLMVVVFQAVLGMWTVTWLLKPIVVMAHLLGGLATLALLSWLAWRATPDTALVQGVAPKLRRLLWVALALVVVQVALGGWTSANYAAMACGMEFPKCLGQWWPPADFREGFVLWRGIGVDYEGGVLDASARVAIQMAHRVVAVLVFGHLMVVAVRMVRTPGLRYWGAVLAALTLAQVGLGIANVRAGLPLHVAVAHTAGAAALLFVVVGLLARLRAPE